jgi:hypothetical protein
MPEDLNYYSVYQVDSAGMPRDHLAIFIETNLPTIGSGFNFQVSGSVQQGMFLNHRPGPRPEDDEGSAFIAKQLIGRVKAEDFDSGRLRDLCDGVPPPEKQFDGPKRLFPAKKLRMCREWVHEVVQVLKKDGVLEEVTSDGRVQR